MSALSPEHRVELGPEVMALLAGEGPKSQFLKHFLRYQQALLAPDSSGLDDVVTPDGRCHELEAMGLPRGREGLKMFRRQVNAALPDERVLVTAVRFEGDDIIEADLIIEATQTGPILGIPATGRRIGFDVLERCRFTDGKLAERWARVDLDEIRRKLTGPDQ